MRPPWKTISFWIYVVALIMPWLLFKMFQGLAPDLWVKLTSRWIAPLINPPDEFHLIALMLMSWIIGGLYAFPFARGFSRKLKSYYRWKQNKCVKCGYDLCMHTPGENCPECGTPIPQQSARIKPADK
jgi:hypothetical protein